MSRSRLTYVLQQGDDIPNLLGVHPINFLMAPAPGEGVLGSIYHGQRLQLMTERKLPSRRKTTGKKKCHRQQSAREDLTLSPDGRGVNVTLRAVVNTTGSRLCNFKGVGFFFECCKESYLNNCQALPIKDTHRQGYLRANTRLSAYGLITTGPSPVHPPPLPPLTHYDMTGD
ncbi:hypothetical protein Bbelb_415650 [Branchiostoma belcheri]|nr:hypothetical protein Bbelb_415650 [Branchiostoma belcheri]